MDIQVGSTVFILSRRCRHWHKLGVVDEMREPGPFPRYHVKFGRGVVQPHESPEHSWFERIDLELRAEMTLEERANYLFGDHWHSAYTLKEPFGETSRCSHQAHDSEPVAPKAVKRLLLNACGCACEFDVCEAHADMDKWWYEVLPWAGRGRAAP